MVSDYKSVTVQYFHYLGSKIKLRNKKAAEINFIIKEY